MTTPDKYHATHAFYAKNAEAYAKQTLALDMSVPQRRLLDALAPGGHILDAGCGAGRDARAFKDAGFTVSAFDACPELACIASRTLGQPVKVMRFQDLEAEHAFDAVYASGSLLHLDEAELADALARLVSALKPGGVLAALFKEGDGVRTEAGTGRLFHDMNRARVLPYLALVGATLEADFVDADTQGRPQGWYMFLARRTR